MRKYVLFIMTAALLISQSFAGLLFTYTKNPITATGSDAPAEKTGYASSFTILGLITIGDAGVKTAAQSAGINEVVYVDSSTFALPFFIFAVNTTEVAGN